MWSYYSQAIYATAFFLSLLLYSFGRKLEREYGQAVAGYVPSNNNKTSCVISFLIGVRY